MPVQLFIYQNTHKTPRLAWVLAALFGCVFGNTCTGHPRSTVSLRPSHTTVPC